MTDNCIAAKLLKGQGLGNQLFCYVSVRCLALEKGYDFSLLGRELWKQESKEAQNPDADPKENKNRDPLYFLHPDMGRSYDDKDFSYEYHEKDDRIFIGNSYHDMEKGCYVSGTDRDLFLVKAGTIIYGNLQSQDYFRKYKAEIKNWLKVDPDYNCEYYAGDNVCIINIRGGEYADSPELFVGRSYYILAMNKMREINPEMQFMAVTDDLKVAHRILPEVPSHHGELHEDYSILHNASYLILSNSSFAFFPAYTSSRAKYIIAPKYWARHNVSDGYWASEQNIYDEFQYMDRAGNVFSAEECRRELESYKASSPVYKKLNTKMTETGKRKAGLYIFWNYRVFRLRKIIAGIWKRIYILKQKSKMS